MSIRDLIETFEGSRIVANASKSAPNQSIESVRSEAFEAGYASGWDDAKVADENTRMRVEAEFERNVEAMTFTYHEALDCVRTEVSAFIDSLLSEFLPKTLPIAIVEHIRSELLSSADSQIGDPIEIVVSSHCFEIVSSFLENNQIENIEIIRDDSLASYQIYMRIAKNEKEINLAPMISELKFQFSAMSDITKKVQYNA